MKVWPQFSEKMIDSVKAILESGQVNQWTNPIIREFEDKFAAYFGSKYAVAVLMELPHLNYVSKRSN